MSVTAIRAPFARYSSASLVYRPVSAVAGFTRIKNSEQSVTIQLRPVKRRCLSGQLFNARPLNAACDGLCRLRAGWELFKQLLPVVNGCLIVAALKRSGAGQGERKRDRKSTRLNSSHVKISYAVFCLKKK